MPANVSDEQINALSEMIFAGHKIEAIKRYREIAGCDLKSAKDSVEDLEKTLRASAPEKFTSSAQGKGCLGVIAVSLVCSGLICHWLSQR